MSTASIRRRLDKLEKSMLRLPETREAMLSVLHAGKAGPVTQLLASKLLEKKVITEKVFAEVREQILKEVGGS